MSPFLTSWPSGFPSIQVSKAKLSPEALSSLCTATGYQGDNISRVRISASKPSFEVGSSSQIKLSFGKKPGRFISAVFLFYSKHNLSTTVQFKAITLCLLGGLSHVMTHKPPARFWQIYDDCHNGPNYSDCPKGTTTKGKEKHDDQSYVTHMKWQTWLNKCACIVRLLSKSNGYLQCGHEALYCTHTKSYFYTSLHLGQSIGKFVKQYYNFCFLGFIVYTFSLCATGLQVGPQLHKPKVQKRILSLIGNLQTGVIHRKMEKGDIWLDTEWVTLIL